MNRRNFVVLLFLSGCLTQAGLVLAEGGGKYPDSVLQLVAQTKQTIKTIDKDEFKAVLDSKAYDMIIDVREPAEYYAGHIANAINIPRGQIEFKIWKHVGFPENTDTSRKTYLYCESGSRCALATRSLQDLGFSNVIAVDMTLNAWRQSGYPLVE